MEIKIMNFGESRDYTPNKSTYAIRIFSSFGTNMMRFKLKESQYYLRISEYIFDDNDTNYKCGPLSLDNILARFIIEDFKAYKERIGCLLVHCTQGRNRSPAVAIALNEIFVLGYDGENMKSINSEFNRMVHKTMLDAAKELGFLD